MTRHVALIPLASRGEAGGELLELYCEASPDVAKDEQERKRGIEPSVEALRPINLHASGQRSMAAVQKLLTSRAKSGFHLDTRKVRFSNKPKSALVEGRSAELGIALAILLSGSGSSVRSVIATGVLEVLPGLLDFDARVEPVESLDEKLRLIAESRRNGVLSRDIDRVLVPAPASGANENDALTEWDSVKALLSLGIRVIPVRTLREAAREVNIKLTDRLAVVRAAAAAAGLALMTAVSGLSWLALQDLPVKFDVDPTGLLGSKPFLVCTDDEARYASYVPVPVKGLVPQVPLTDVLGWRIRLGEDSSADAHVFEALQGVLGLGYYRLAVVFVGQVSGLHVLPTEGGAQQVMKPPGHTWEWGQQVDKPEEAGVLLFLVKRFGNFDLGGLEADFRERFGNGRIDLSSAANFAAEQATGSLSYFFEAVERTSPCAASSPTLLPLR